MDRRRRPSRTPVPRAARTPALPVLTTALLLALSSAGCGEAAGPPPDSPEYREVVAAFYTGVAAIQVGEDERAEGALRTVVELAPREPAGPANLALLAFQQGRWEDAARWLERARADATGNARLALLDALVERELGHLDVAAERLRTAVAGDSVDLRALVLLSRVLEERAGAGDAEASRQALDRAVSRAPGNLWLRVESARHAARHGNAEALAGALDALRAVASTWPEPVRRQLARVRQAATLSDAGTELAVLAARLEPLPDWARDRSAATVSEQRPDLVVTHFLRLPTPSPRPPAPDLEMTWAPREIPVPASAPAGTWTDVRPVWPGGDSAARVALVGREAVWVMGDTAVVTRLGRPGPPAGTPGARAAAGGLAGPVPAESSLALLDLDGDFLLDVAIAGEGGLRLVIRDSANGLTPAPDGALPEGVAGAAMAGVWAVDADLDGDVDLVAAPVEGAPFVLRNRGDGTFDRVPRFPGVAGARQLAWGDLDDDGDPDAVFLDAGGRLHAFANPRQDRPVFEPMPLPETLGSGAALALGDMDADGTFDLLVLGRDGNLVRAWREPDGWHTGPMASWNDSGDASTAAPPPGPARLFVADVDDNGAMDAVASMGTATRVWLGNADRRLVAHTVLDAGVTAVADLVGGQVEMLGVDPSGHPVRFTPRPTRSYHALVLSPRATAEPGDGRINTFGLGGEAEVRAGLLYQKQPIADPMVHFGIGDNTGVTVARIVWPNGTAQAEFDLLATLPGHPVVAQQRLKGSCPWLFAFDGEGMRFVTDIAWRTALGLRINAVGAGAVVHSPDRVKLDGDRLAPRDGFYDLRVTAELWESHFFDQVALLAVDHPPGTEVFVDERFVLPPPDTAVRVTGPLHALAGARDDRGRDVTGILAALDERYVDDFSLGRYQGLAQDHAVVLDLGPSAPVDGPLVLVAQGWVYPTDGSINLALGQGRLAPPRGVRVEVPDGMGGWRVLHDDMGMPAGKTKTMLVDLDGAFVPGVPPRVRLSTTMEVYWDRIAWAEARPGADLRIVRLTPDVAELRYRGFSHTRQAGRRAPELPEYDVATTAPLWRDLEGYHTRFGDVLPLLEAVDDRYVIMNAGDELRLRFPVLPAPSGDRVRDWIVASDAWVKDGDYNNGFSGSLRPLPYHGMAGYDRPPGPLEDDPAYRLHPDDWREYHTRWVTPSRFQHALSR